MNPGEQFVFVPTIVDNIGAVPESKIVRSAHLTLQSSASSLSFDPLIPQNPSYTGNSK